MDAVETNDRLTKEYQEYRSRVASQGEEIMSYSEWVSFRSGGPKPEIKSPPPPVDNGIPRSPLGSLNPSSKPESERVEVELAPEPEPEQPVMGEPEANPEQPETVDPKPEPEAPFEDDDTGDNGEIDYEPELSVGEYPEYEPEEFDEPEQPSSPESVNIPSPVVEPVDESTPDGQPDPETVEPSPEQPEIVEDEQPLALTLKAQLDQATVKYNALTDMLDAITDKRNALEIEMEVLSIKLQQIPKSNKPLSPSRKKADDLLESMLAKLNLNQGK